MSSDQCWSAGLSDDRLAPLVRSGLWQRVCRGVYDVEPEKLRSRAPESERRRAAWLGLLAFGPDAVAVGTSALTLHGVAGLPLEVMPEAALPKASRRRDRGRARLRQFDDGMRTVTIKGRQVANIEWALAQAVPELGRRNAVAVLDSVLHLGLTDRRGIDRAHRLARGRRGVARTHEWWALADGLAESPLETFGRLDCLDLGIPPDELQIEVRSRAGEFLGRGDMGWRLEDGRWLIAEMDGRLWHDLPNALYQDRRRQNALMGVAEILRFTSADVYAGSVGTTVRRHLRSRRPPRTTPSRRTGG